MRSVGWSRILQVATYWSVFQYGGYPLRPYLCFQLTASNASALPVSGFTVIQRGIQCNGRGRINVTGGTGRLRRRLFATQFIPGYPGALSPPFRTLVIELCGAEFMARVIEVYLPPIPIWLPSGSCRTKSVRSYSDLSPMSSTKVSPLARSSAYNSRMFSVQI